MRRPYGFILSNRMWILNFQERKDNFLIIKLISPLFPQKLTIISGKIRTPKINEALALTTMINKHLQEHKKGEKSNKIDFSPMVTAKGFKPPTLRAEIWCAIQLRHAAKIFLNQLPQDKPTRYSKENNLILFDVDPS